MTYSKLVTFMVRSKIIDWAIGMMTKGELTRATATWKQVHFWCSYVWVTPIASHRFKGTQRSREGGQPLPKLQPYSIQRFCLDDVWGSVHTTQKVTIPPFGTVSIHGNTGVWGHCMQGHVLAEPAQGPQLPASVVLIGHLWGIAPRVFSSTNLFKATQKGTPIYPQQPRPGQNILDQALDLVNGSDALQGALLLYTAHMHDDVKAISRRCWILVPSGSHTVCGLAW